MPLHRTHTARVTGSGDKGTKACQAYQGSSLTYPPCSHKSITQPGRQARAAHEVAAQAHRSKEASVQLVTISAGHHAMGGA